MPDFAAVLPAAGKGSRLSNNGAVSKQFMMLQGRPLFLWSLSVLVANPDIGKVIVAAPPDMVTTVNEIISQQTGLLGSSSEISVTAGDTTRQGSVFNGLKFLKATGAPENVLVHDAARPFLTADLVAAAVVGVRDHGACTLGIRPADSIRKMSGEKLNDSVDRDALILVQTPQGAKFNWLLEAHEQANEKQLATTDDATLLIDSGHEVFLVPGSPLNIKVTQPEDLVLSEAISSIVFADRL